MSFVNSALDYIMDFRKKPRYVPAKLNRVDADMRLVQYHETGIGPKPPPQETNYLPVRTRLALAIFSDMNMAQTHAYYEEIDNVPAASVEKKSEFKAGHWHVVHPVSSVEMLDFSTRVLQDLLKWIEEDCPSDMFIRKAGQVLEFKVARSETLENAKKELEKRKGRGDVGEEEGYTGSWEQVGEDKQADETQMDGKTKMEGKGKEKAQGLSRHTAAALAEAEQAGRNAAEEARIKDEYDFA
ncbi:uncharacterized protein K460DRAFT_403125 [Cucurbitaria berberidis CBS 394.84]|uniref:Uncharacterized protein n=1 Tax=Cucurbitaria berberidis CBS 394.84 TaxID=1168544 RepID=A0A9P4GLE4_9PLEO|nr:uncharacterized protein K460DRAFT_403125 [Cucurbitaria berberidis CBS 394.84]KAF1847802.1 hypothetical protein K460DRAFT_403125 [Cucurbitaria berberidis CBS 394.84]